MTRYGELRAFLDRSEVLLGRWDAAFARSALSLPGRIAPADARPLITNIVQEFAQALPREDADSAELEPLAPGSPGVRELEKATGFAGATWAGQGGSGFDLAAALLALRDLLGAAAPGLRAELDAVFEWLLVVALDAFASASAAAAEERQWQQLEQKTPVVLVAPFLPALLLVGMPDRLGMTAIFSRLLLSVVRVGARAAIVDATGHSDPGVPYMLECLSEFLSHRKIARRLHLLTLGLDKEHQVGWSEVCQEHGVAFEHSELFHQAVARGLALQGHVIRLGREG